MERFSFLLAFEVKAFRIFTLQVHVYTGLVEEEGDYSFVEFVEKSLEVVFSKLVEVEGEEAVSLLVVLLQASFIIIHVDEQEVAVVAVVEVDFSLQKLE